MVYYGFGVNFLFRVNDEVRRTRLGLEFLKGMSQDNIEALVRRSKEKGLEFESQEIPIASIIHSL